MDKETIKKDVVDNLYWDMRIDASNVKVEVSDGKVTLKGSVPSYSSIRAATDDTWNVSGVTHVDNQLTVEYPTELTLPTDSEIQSNIENVLLWDSDVDSTKVDVEVENGIVILKGDVDAYWKVYHVENKSDVTGVIDVVNKLAVVPTEDVLDKDIAKDVVNALTRNFNVDVDDVNVKVKDGKVTLTGTVPSWTAYTSAETSAFYTLGVTEVDNQLTISY